VQASKIHNVLRICEDPRVALIRKLRSEVDFYRQQLAACSVTSPPRSPLIASSRKKSAATSPLSTCSCCHSVDVASQILSQSGRLNSTHISAAVPQLKAPVQEISAQESCSDAASVQGATVNALECVKASLLGSTLANDNVDEHLTPVTGQDELALRCQDLAPNLPAVSGDADLPSAASQRLEGIASQSKYGVQVASDDNGCDTLENKVPKQADVPKPYSAEQLLRQKFVEVSNAQQQAQHENERLQEENAELRELASLLASVAVVCFRTSCPCRIGKECEPSTHLCCRSLTPCNNLDVLCTDSHNDWHLMRLCVLMRHTQACLQHIVCLFPFAEGCA
jgi:flagellar hook-basal body complex protein FliE